MTQLDRKAIKAFKNINPSLQALSDDLIYKMFANSSSFLALKVQLSYNEFLLKVFKNKMVSKICLHEQRN